MENLETLRQDIDVTEAREVAMFDKLRQRALELDLNPDLISKLWRSIIDEVVSNHESAMTRSMIERWRKCMF